MPVTDQTTSNSSTGNGVTTVFPYTFKILDEADILVEVDGVAQTLTTHYTVSGVGVSGGGNVTFGTAPALDTVVVRSRSMAYARDTDYQENGDLLAATLDEDVDRVTMLVQQVRQLIRRAVKLPSGVTTDQVLSTGNTAAERASKVIGFDPNGDPSLLGLADIDVALVSAYMATLLDDANAAAARTTLGLIIGTDVQAYDVDTAKLDVAQTFSAAQSFPTATAPEHALRFDQYKNRLALVSAASGAGSPANTAENNLKSATTVAGVLSTNGDTLHFVNKYRCVANATTKRLRVYFGSTVIADSTAIAHNGVNIVVEGWIIRTGATTQVIYIRVSEGALGAAWNTALVGLVIFTTSAETLANALTLKTTCTLGAGAALNDVIQDSMYYEILKT